jgi:hypothetical protein
MKDSLHTFEELAISGQPVELLNAYRGISVVNRAIVKQVQNGYVTIDIHPHQAVCIAIENQTLVRSDHFPQVLRAHAVAVDVPGNQGILADFIEAGIKIGRRTATRVQAAHPLDADIYHNFQRLPCKLADISTTGIGLFAIETYIYSGHDFTLGGEVVVDISLPVVRNQLRFQGKITSLADTTSRYLRRIGLEIFPDERSKPILEDYVQQRQQELLNELNRVYQAMTTS